MPFAIEAVAGVTDIEISTGVVTVSVAEAVIKPEVALMFATPKPIPVDDPPVAMVATAVAAELQFTVLVKSCVLPSLYIPVAMNCWLMPFAIDAVAGVIERETKIGALTRTLAELVTDP